MNLSKRLLCFFVAFLLISLSFISLRVHADYSGTNLEPLNAFYDEVNGAASSYAHIDYSVTHDGHPSIRVENDYVRGTREVDGAYLEVHPNDHIYVGIWVKTSNDQDNNGFSGGRIGLDMRGDTDELGWTMLDSLPHYYGYVDGVWCSDNNEPPGSDYYADGLGCTPVSQFQVPFGNDWTWVYWDFYVPSEYYTQNEWGSSCTGAQINNMVPWIDVRTVSGLNGGTAWFSDPVCYIMPSGSAPSPGPSPSPWPSETPHPTPGPSFIFPHKPSPTPISYSSPPSNPSDLSGIAGAFGALMVIAMLSGVVDSMTKTRKNS